LCRRARRVADNLALARAAALAARLRLPLVALAFVPRELAALLAPSATPGAPGVRPHPLAVGRKALAELAALRAFRAALLRLRVPLVVAAPSCPWTALCTFALACSAHLVVSDCTAPLGAWTGGKGPAGLPCPLHGLDSEHAARIHTEATPPPSPYCCPYPCPYCTLTVADERQANALATAGPEAFLRSRRRGVAADLAALATLGDGRSPAPPARAAHAPRRDPTRGAGIVPLDPRVQLPLFARRAGGAGGEEDAALLAGAMGEWRLQAEQPGAEWWWWWAEQGEGAGADAGAPDAGATGALGGVVGGGVVRWDEVDVLLDEAARLQAEGVGAVAAGPVCTAVTEAAGVRALHQALASGGAGGGRRGDGVGYPFSEQEEGEWLLEAVEGWLSAGALSPCRVMLAALACLGERPSAGEGGEGFARGASAAARGAAGGAVVLHSFAAGLARSAPAAAPGEGDGCAEEAAGAPAARAWPGDGGGVMELELSGGDELVGVDVSGEGWVQVAPPPLVLSGHAASLTPY
jgi:hypothetical protein